MKWTQYASILLASASSAFCTFFFQTKVDMKLGARRDQTILPPTVVLGEHGRVIYIVGDVGLCG